MEWLRYLIFGKKAPTPVSSHAYDKVQMNLRAVWNQTLYRDFGIERLLRLLLVVLGFILPGTLFRYLISQFSRSFLLRRAAVELFALLKVGWFIWLLHSGTALNGWWLAGSVVLTLDTFHFLLSRIFLADVHPGHTSFRRSLLLMIVNFWEMCLAFAASYLYLDYHLAATGGAAFSRHPITAVEAIYFSVITSATVGYGDIHPIAPVVMKLVVVQIAVSLFFVVVYLSSVINNLDKGGELSRYVHGSQEPL